MNIFRTDLSPHITSYDLLKTFALITMVIDHIGLFFFPYIEEVRLIGRLSAPVWFFLIGYAMTRKLEIRLWVWAFILLIGFLILRGNGEFLPLNILFNFLLIRATLNFVMVRAQQNFETLFGFFWLFALLAMPLIPFLEYGTFGYLFAMLGYLARRRQDIKTLQPKHIYGFTALVASAYSLGMWVELEFSVVNTALLTVLIFIQLFLLLSFKSLTFPIRHPLLGAFKYPFFLAGRRTLEFYVVHLLIFMYLWRYGSF